MHLRLRCGPIHGSLRNRPHVCNRNGWKGLRTEKPNSRRRAGEGVVGCTQRKQVRHPKPAPATSSLPQGAARTSDVHQGPVSNGADFSQDGDSVPSVHIPTGTMVPGCYISQMLFLVMKGEKERLILNESWPLHSHSCIFSICLR